MPTLPDDLRDRLEKAVNAARDKAEDGAHAALQRLYVETADSKAIPAGFSEASRTLRVHLRAHARQLGDQVPEKGPQKIGRLVTECAYEFWHRMLFARFLAENNLLIHPDSKVSISLEDCKEFGAAETPPTDGWTFASRCAARMLPQIFRPDDPLLQVPFAPEHKLALERILAELPTDIFTADDGLGWVYQFWQTKRKEEIKKSEVKIGGDELPAVTQFFTEHYMVLFLLHNTLGAWWVNRQAQSGGCKPAEVALPGYTFAYLRFGDDGTPAAGTFPGWPATARALKVLDPCCGSGHFLVAAFDLLVRIRMHNERLSPRDACDAVLRDNLFGLELDARCTQIAAFNLALAAWKFQQTHGVFDSRRLELPPLHIACSGQAPKGDRKDWLRLANGDKRLRWGMDLLYDLFEKANDLGSLIDPRTVKAAPSVAGSFEELQPMLQQVLQREDVQKDAELLEAGVMAQGIAKAADLLTGEYTLVTTNVPYLGLKKQADDLAAFLTKNYLIAKYNLATAFLLRALGSCIKGGTIALVTLQDWLFLKSYEPLREHLLHTCLWQIVGRLGSGAFQEITGAVVNVILVALTKEHFEGDHQFIGIDATEAHSTSEKATRLRQSSLSICSQGNQLKNPNSRITFSHVNRTRLLEDYAICPRGIVAGDIERWARQFWELPELLAGWEKLQVAATVTTTYGGRSSIIDWSRKGKGMLRPGLGNKAYGRLGVAVSVMNTLPATIYTGELYDQTTAAIVPLVKEHQRPIWAFCSSDEFTKAVRNLDQALKVTPATLLKVPFDLAHWQSVADANGPLPEPHSNDPTQWLFKGDVGTADAPQNLQVAMARLLGYRWPDQPADDLDALADKGGIVCLPAIGKEKAADERLRELLAAAYGADWSPAREEGLLAASGFGGKTLRDWLRDGFFEQHCKLFQSRPFLWHIWDGLKNGFSAIVNYHKFDEPRLRDLIYHHLAEWIKRQAQDVEKGESGADARHAAALELHKKLKLIHEGEKPYDIFIRWKPLDQQPIGWEPDPNDGVRLNIRPFMEANVLPKKLNIKWKKDKGRDPESAPWFHLFKGDRINDHHLGLEEKRNTRGQGGKA